MNFYFDFIKQEYYESIRKYRDEFLTYDSQFDGCAQLKNYQDIEKWHLNCKLFEQISTLPPGYPMSFEYLYIDNGEVIGMVNFRPIIENNVYASQYGGHIGYSIKPSRRKQGIGTKMLHDFLPICKEFGLVKVMISCFSDNEASRKIILNNGGVFDSKVLFPAKNTEIERYWISLQ